MKHNISIQINGKAREYNEVKEDRSTDCSKHEVAVTYDEAIPKNGFLQTSSLRKPEVLVKRKKNGLFPKNRTGFYFQNKGTGNRLQKQLLAAVMAAVFTGVILGLLVMMVFSSDITEAGKNQANPALTQNRSKGSSKTVSISPIELKFSALQIGVFSTKERAMDAVKLIEENGFSSLVLPSEDDKFSVLIGISNESNQLDRFKEDYEKQMEKVWPKNITYKFDHLKTPSNMDEPYFTNGKTLLQNVLTLSQLPGTNKEALDKTYKEFTKWKQNGDQQRVNWKKSTTKASLNFEKQLEGAFIALKDSKKERVNWAFQQKAMDSFKAYKELLTTINE